MNGYNDPRNMPQNGMQAGMNPQGGNPSGGLPAQPPVGGMGGMQNAAMNPEFMKYIQSLPEAERNALLQKIDSLL